MLLEFIQFRVSDCFVMFASNRKVISKNIEQTKDNVIDTLPIIADLKSDFVP
tara:strand:- start:110 stop:265 length:156 start_codon:yes stop_codon:yes gene_type:complete